MLEESLELIIPVDVFKEIIRLLGDALAAGEMYHIKRIETFALDEEKETADRDRYDMSTKEYLLKLNKQYFSPYLHGMIKNLLKIDYINTEEVIIKGFDVSGIDYVLDEYLGWLEVEHHPENYVNYDEMTKRHLYESINFTKNLHLPLQEYIESIKGFLEVIRACSSLNLIDKKYNTVKGYVELCKKYI